MSYPSQADPVAPQRIIDPVIPAAFIPIWDFAQSHDNDSFEEKSSWVHPCSLLHLPAIPIPVESPKSR